MPTPHPTAWTSTHSPAATLRPRHQRVVRGDERLGDAAHRHEVEPVGNRARTAPRARATYSACAPPPTMPNTGRRRLDAAATPRPARLDDAGELEPGDVGRDAGRRGVEAARVAGGRPGSGPAPCTRTSDLVVGRLRASGGRRRRPGRRRPWLLASRPGRLTAPAYREYRNRGDRWALRFLDDDGTRSTSTPTEAAALLAHVGDLDAATVSACPDCRVARARGGRARRPARRASAPHPRAGELRRPRRRRADAAPLRRRRRPRSAGTGAGATRSPTSGSTSSSRRPAARTPRPISRRSTQASEECVERMRRGRS